MCKIFTKSSKPQVENLVASAVQVREDLAGIELMHAALLDDFQPYFYTKAEDWAKVFDYIYFSFKMPDYIRARMDCEDFAVLMKGLVSALFGLNWFGLVMGNTPAGYHAWNLFKAENGIWQLEPQTGEFFLLGEKSYLPQYILI